MKASLIFSSKTGNTKRVTDEILNILPKETKVYDLKELDTEVEDELLILGFWVDRAKPNQEMYEFMEGLKGKKIIAFGTMGTDPSEKHGENTRKNTTELLSKNNELLGIFLCQGKIDQNITKMFINRGDDFKNAREFVKNLVNM